jgi:hypothetical protein
VSVGPQLGLLIVLAGVVLALAFIVAGVFRVLAPGKLLREHVERLGAPPFLAYVVEEARGKIDAAQYAVSTLPDLVERAKNAILKIERAGERMRAAANSLGSAAKALGALLAS